MASSARNSKAAMSTRSWHLTSLAVIAALVLSTAGSIGGEYKGPLRVEMLPDGRSIKLLEDFAFVDNRQQIWTTPVGTVVDGASIPQPLWSFMGGPLSGLYRDASVIHDYYCELQDRPFISVHEVFYDAMITSGVTPATAKIMYLAVFQFGPRWGGGEDPCDTAHPTFCYANKKEPRDWSQEKFDKIRAYIEVNPDMNVDDPNAALRQILNAP